jgi:8-oxo-dGTP pyrophosphatase MutT (NUDIX family)
MTAKKKSAIRAINPAAADDMQPAEVSSVPADTKSSPKSGKPARSSKSTDKPSSAGATTPRASGASTKTAKSKVAKVAKVARKSVKPSKANDAPKSVAKKPRIATKPKNAAKVKASSDLKADNNETEKILESQVVYEGKLFRVLHDHVIEPGGRESERDVIRHNGSVVILAVDPAKRKKNPWIVIERQYRHAAGQFLWELPAGKLDAGETPLEGAKRELAEETGYQAKKWTSLVEYFASPGFLGESMKVFLAEGLVAGDAHPEEDELIDFRLVKLSDLLEMVDEGKIIDGKTLTTILLYARHLGLKRKK